MYELETLIVAIIAACFGAVGVLYFIGKSLYDRYYTPKFKAFYPDGSTKLSCRIGEERRICINIENYGRTGTKVEKLFYYFPQDFEMKKIFYLKEHEIKRTGVGAGIFDGYQYVSCNQYEVSTGLYFSSKEKHEVYFDVKFPKKR